MEPGAGRRGAPASGLLAISHETIYRYIWADKRRGGQLHTHCAGPRSAVASATGATTPGPARRQATHHRAAGGGRDAPEGGHWEIDTVLGTGDRHSVLSLVERATGLPRARQARARTTAAVTRRAIQLIRRERQPVHTITADNGTEFHTTRASSAATGATFYFATPHHAWERGTNENTNGLMRQYLPKGQSMAQRHPARLHAIARDLNTRPRKRHRYQTPEECYATLT